MNITALKSIEFIQNGEKKLIIDSVNNYMEDPIGVISYVQDEIHINCIIISGKSDIELLNESDIYSIHLFDNVDYWISFEKNANHEDYDLIEKIVSKRSEKKAVLNSGNYIGFFDCNYFGINLELEFVSRKLDYDKDFNYLQSDIEDFCMELLARSSSYYAQHFCKSDEYISSNKIEYTQIAFLRNLLRPDRLPDWIDYIIQHPEHRFILEKQMVSISEIDTIDVDSIIDAMRPDNINRVVNEKLLLPNGIVPIEIEDKKLEMSYDTNENRFIKFFIEQILEFITESIEIVNSKNIKLFHELKKMKNVIDEKIENPFWNEIGNLNGVPYNSQILQRKYPYNLVFQAFNEFELKAKLSTGDVAEKYSVGAKDAPMLYQYWTFIRLFKYLSKKYEKNYRTSDWITYDKSNINFTLKEGRSAYAVFELENRKKLSLLYNKTYDQRHSIYDGRSYSHDLKPDISLELFDSDELVGIVHFDAKYKLPENTTNIEDDINKMHAYKDGIIGTVGAYALCLSQKKVIFHEEEIGFHGENDIFPSVGAFPMNLDEKNIDKELDDVFGIIDKFANIELSSEINKYSKNRLHTYMALTRRIGKIKENTDV